MILAIDVGNTNIVVGCIDDRKTYFIERLSTNRTKTELEYAVDLKNVLDIYHIKKTEIEGCIISSVVPQITNIVKLAAEKILKKNAIVLGPGVKTGLNIMMDNPGQLGEDQVADAVAGIAGYPVPLILIDMGTATTASVVNSKKHHLSLLSRRKGPVKDRSEGCQDQVRFFALHRINPHAPPLVRAPVNFFEF